MEIRKATIDDLPELIRLGRAMHEESPRFRDWAFADEKAAALAQNIVGGAGLALVAVKDGEVIGMLASVVAEHFFSYAPYAADLVVYVTPAHRGSSACYRMVRQWDQACSEVVVESVLGISTDVAPERTRKLYEKLGYKLSGYIMVKRYVRRTN